MSTFICNLNISYDVFGECFGECFLENVLENVLFFQMENVVLFANNSQFMRAEKRRKAAISTSSI